MKAPLRLNCKICHQHLQKSVVCDVCFKESAVTPFIEFKTQYLTQIENIQIGDRQLSKQSLQQAQRELKLSHQRRRIDIYNQILHKSHEELDNQLSQIEIYQAQIEMAQKRTAELRSVVNTMEDQCAESTNDLDESKKQISKVTQNIQKIRSKQFQEIFILTDVAQPQLNEIYISRFSIPSFEGEQQTTVSAESIEINTEQIPQTKARAIIFTLEQLFRRLQLLATIFKVQLPYRMLVRGRNEFCLGDKKLFLSLDVQLIQESTGHYKQLIAANRKKKQGIYIDQQALGLMQTNTQVVLSRIGNNQFEDRVLCLNKQSLKGFMVNLNGFNKIYRSWDTYLLTSRMDIVEKQLQITEDHFDEPEFQKLNLVRDIASIHSSDQDFEF